MFRIILRQFQRVLEYKKILKKMDQHVNVKWVLHTKMNLKYALLVIKLVQLAFESQLMAVQIVILIYIKFSEGQNMSVNLAIMNQIIFVKIVPLLKIVIDLTKCYNLYNGNQLLWHTDVCSNCDIGYELILNRCQFQCEDFRLSNLFEEYEDGNYNLDDLCYNCKFQCPKHCLTCNSTTTLPYPDIWDDGIITGDEEYEDGNNIQYDGYYQQIVQNVSHLDGWLIHQSNYGHSKNNVEIVQQLEMNNIFLVQLVAHPVIILSINVKVVNKQDMLLKNIIVEIFVEMDQQQMVFIEYCHDGNNNRSSKCNSDSSACAFGYYQQSNQNVSGDKIMQLMKYVNQEISYLKEDARIVQQDVRSLAKL
ncbi:unnamed protein product [Paramecium sonneborni]|uniref:Uncharacterized protein n=1 Tax=Paramecium sonneborni TaxID=65129 RepID=A0A8S1LF42_9CILI|nr:unnamed protein product [Paramecium sonneborni]